MPHSSLCSLTYFHDLHHPSIQCFSHVFSFPILLSTQSSGEWRMDLVIDPSTKKTHHSPIQCFSHSLSLHPLLLSTQSFSPPSPYLLTILLSPSFSLPSLSPIVVFTPLSNAFLSLSLPVLFSPNPSLHPVFPHRCLSPSIQCFSRSLSLHPALK